MTVPEPAQALRLLGSFRLLPGRSFRLLPGRSFRLLPGMLEYSDFYSQAPSPGLLTDKVFNDLIYTAYNYQTNDSGFWFYDY